MNETPAPHTCYEQHLLHSKSINRDRVRLFCKILQTVRSSSPQKDSRQQVIWDTATTVIGPAFFFFTQWVIQRAQKKNIQRLYFLSRDGEIFYRIAQLMEKKFRFGLEYRYLYGSRHLWLTSCLEKIRPQELEWMFSDWWYVLTVRTVCRRAGINPEDIKDILTANGFPEKLWDKRFSHPEKGRFKKCFRDPLLQKTIIDRSEIRFQNTVGYLLQEGLGEDVNYAIVDIGWRGKPQASLKKILARGKILPPRGLYGLYFGITEGKEIYRGDQADGFLFDLSKSLVRFNLRNNHLFEAFASSCEGRITDFACREGRYAPVLDEQSAQATRQWGVQLQQDGILAFCREFLKSDLDNRLSLREIYEILSRLLGIFIENPSEQEADVYGSFPMDGEMTGTRIQPIAPAVSRKRFWSLCLNLKNFDLFWVQASLVRSQLKLERLLWKSILPLIEIVFYSQQLLSGRAAKVLDEK